MSSQQGAGMMLNAALEYTERGWHVFPLHSTGSGRCTCGHGDCASPGKHPRTLNGCKDATNNAEQIRAWWSENPDANIGIATGERSNLAVLDIDAPERFQSFAAEHGVLPPTLIASTGKGVHLYYSYANGVRNKARIAEGIDVRGEGGYVVAPPSLHVNGKHYGWDDPAKPVAPWPEKLSRLLEKPKHAPIQVPPVAYDGGGTPYGLKALAEEIATLKTAQEGERNDTYNRVAYNLFQLVAGNQLDDALVTSELTFCARGIGLEEKEIQRTLDSARSAGLANPRVPPDNTPVVVDSVPAGSTPNPETSGNPPRLAYEPRILDKFVEKLPALGIVGEDEVAKLIYLAGTSRLFPSPSNVAVKGVSSSGKSVVVKCALSFLPPEAYIDLTSMSELGLVYMEDELKHRIVVLYEAHSLTDDSPAAYIMRSLLSEQRIRHQTVIKQKGVLIEKEGPTGLITTTTRVNLFEENETRMLSVTVDDSSEQTARVLGEIGKAAERGEEWTAPDLTEWHNLQRWLAGKDEQTCRVVVPYGQALMSLVAPVAVRLRRDAQQVIGLIKAHALLHRATRERDARGRIVATLDDYAAVREIVGPLIADAAGITVPATVKETVEAIRDLADDYPNGVTLKALEKPLKLDRSAISRRTKRAESLGFIVNLEEREKQPRRFELGDPMPEASELLPTVEALGEALTSTPPAHAAHDAQDPEARISAQDVHIGKTASEQGKHGDLCTCASCAGTPELVQTALAQDVHKSEDFGQNGRSDEHVPSAFDLPKSDAPSLEEQAARVAAWNASLDRAPTLDEIPTQKGPGPKLKGGTP